MYLIIKRCLELFLSLVLLVVLSPLILIIAVLIKIDSKGPIIFRQDRLGKNGKVFQFYKFRSMVVNAEKQGTGVYSDKQDSRVTRVGKFIRATSLDELPQLVNIIKGDMSLIGPRPPLTYHPWPFEEYSDEQKIMFNVRPGITGWAQINGRKDVEWNKRIEMNVWYVKHISFLLDVRIFFVTLIKVLKMSDNVNVGKTKVQAPEIDDQNEK